MDHASFWLKTGTPHLPKWYMLLTEVVYTAYRNGTLSLPKTGTLLGTDYNSARTASIVSPAARYSKMAATIWRVSRILGLP